MHTSTAVSGAHLQARGMLARDSAAFFWIGRVIVYSDLFESDLGRSSFQRWNSCLSEFASDSVTTDAILRLGIKPSTCVDCTRRGGVFGVPPGSALSVLV